MNFGLMVRKALQRAELPVNDAEHLNLGRDMANDAITDLWYLAKADWRQARDKIVTVPGSDEYIVNKLIDIPINQGFVPNSLRGPVSNPRTFTYKDPDEFFRITRNFQSSQGIPYIYTFGDLSGIDAQLTTGSKIKVFSSLASKTMGSVNVSNGSSRIVGTQNGQFTLNDVGQRIKLDGDSLSYLVSVFIDDKNIDVDEVYRGNDQQGASYKLGDVGIHANVQGYIGGEVDSEDVVLDGANPVFTTKNFSTLISCSKSDLTGGRVTFQDSTGVLTVATLAPAETEAERQTVVLWRIPAQVETLNYRFFMKHPTLRADTDRPLVPSKYHNIITYMTEVMLREWAGMPVGDYLKSLIDQGKTRFVNDSNDSSLWTTIPQDVNSNQFNGQTDVYNKLQDPDFTYL